jgi:hypothetical protein
MDYKNNKVVLTGDDFQKSKQLIDIIKDICKKTNMNKLIVSPTILTIIESSKDFNHISNMNVNYLESPILMGIISNIDCYIDFRISLTDVILKHDEKTIRDIKINSIINNIEEEYEIKLEVIY